MSYDVKEGELENHVKDAAMQQAVDEPDPKPEDRVLTMDEARATVIRGSMMVVKKSMESFDKLVCDTPSAEENKKSLLRASLEFYATLEAQLRRFERPAILRSSKRRPRLVR